jgi:hypothetical protein
MHKDPVIDETYPSSWANTTNFSHVFTSLSSLYELGSERKWYEIPIASFFGLDRIG